MRNKDDLVRELQEDGDAYFASGRVNNICDIVLSIAAIAGSLIATVVVSAGGVRGWIAAAVAAVPAACGSVQGVLDLRGRSNCYFLGAARVRSLAIALEYAEKPNLDEFARKRGELEVELENDWSRIGRSSVSPPSRRQAGRGVA